MKEKFPVVPERVKKVIELKAKHMKRMLWGVLQKLEKGEIEPAKADAMAMQSREIVRITHSQLSILRQGNKKVTKELLDYAR